MKKIRIDAGWVKAILMLLGVAAVAAFALWYIITSDNVGIGSKAREANLELISSEVVDFKSFAFQKVKGKSEPEQAKPYVVVRNTRDGWSLSKLSSGINVNRRWDSEDIAEVEVIVFVVSSYKTKGYEVYQDGIHSGSTSLSTESVKLYFYNTKTKGCFGTEEIKGAPLPEKTKKGDLKISDSKITEAVRAKLGIEGGNGVFYKILGAAACAAIVAVPAVIIVKKVREKKRKA